MGSLFSPINTLTCKLYIQSTRMLTLRIQYANEIFITSSLQMSGGNSQSNNEHLCHTISIYTQSTEEIMISSKENTFK